MSTFKSWAYQRYSPTTIFLNSSLVLTVVFILMYIAYIIVLFRCGARGPCTFALVIRTFLLHIRLANRQHSGYCFLSGRRCPTSTAMFLYINNLLTASYTTHFSINLLVRADAFSRDSIPFFARF